MKPTKLLLSMLAFCGMLAFTACDDDDDAAPMLMVQSITASGTDLESGNTVETDLNAATSAEDVPVDPVITVTFSEEINANSASAANVTLTSDAGNVPVTVTGSGRTMTITPQEELMRGTDYTLTLSGNITSAQGGTFTSTSRTFTTGGRGTVTPPQAESQTLYLSLDGNAELQEGDATVVFEQVDWGTDRFGFANSAANFRGATAPGNGDLIELQSAEGFIYPSITITNWFKVDPADYTGSRFMFGVAAERGYFMEFGTDGIAWMKLATSHIVNPDPSNHQFGTSWTDPNGDGNVGGQIVQEFAGSISDLVADGEWHQLAITYDAAESMKTVYIDGVVLIQADIDSETTEWFLKDLAFNDMGVEDLIDANLALGFAGSRGNLATGWAVYANAENTYKGMLDDFRIFNTALTAAEIQTLYNAEAP